MPACFNLTYEVERQSCAWNCPPPQSKHVRAKLRAESMKPALQCAYRKTTGRRGRPDRRGRPRDRPGTSRSGEDSCAPLLGVRPRLPRPATLAWIETALRDQHPAHPLWVAKVLHLTRPATWSGLRLHSGTTPCTPSKKCREHAAPALPCDPGADRDRTRGPSHARGEFCIAHSMLTWKSKSATAKGSLAFPGQHGDFSVVDNTELLTRARRRKRARGEAAARARRPWLILRGKTHHARGARAAARAAALAHSV